MTIPILVADSSEEFGILIRHTLEETGRYQVILTGNGAGAIEIAQSRDLHLAIIDFDLPDMDGAECIRQLRALQSDIAIIAIPYSNNPNDPVLQDLNVNGLLSKPFYLPELSQIVSEALKLPTQVEDARPSARPAPVEVRPVTTAKPAPHWLKDEKTTNQLLDALSQETSAFATMITRGRRLWAFSGEISPAQSQELVSMIADFGLSDAARGAITKFVRLSGDRQDYVLYASALTGDWILTQIFSADIPFGAVRQQAHNLARALQEKDPASVSPQPEWSTPETLPGATDEESMLDMPADWLPEDLGTQPDLPFLDGLDLPPPDPSPDRERPIAQIVPEVREGSTLPGDWIPDRTQPAAYLSFLEASPDPGDRARAYAGDHVPLPEAEYYLPMTVILVPRFPEHQLSGYLAENLRDWVARLCLAWDWRADAIEIQEDYMSLTISLSPEVAPSSAVAQLRADLSQRVLKAYPEFTRDLPSNRFWARSFLLFTGGPPQPERVRAFVENTRRSQGLTR